MNFTDNPFERMMKQIPRQGRANGKPCGGAVPSPQPKPKKEQETYRDIVITDSATSGQFVPKSE